ncbi:plasma-membrane choline transporter-domain-containing protein [Ephemerocybe angulata]|uniref:Plasma-membrane choline transporter-domain-containing protein n=1 Tax=Ephemerocybe angulata TaxID=980116 RepID=A0A8H6IDF5_9AGAR|nr:plasma-membrane choline transporter-domain-containing protein [Tulosesus angulatus]
MRRLCIMEEEMEEMEDDDPYLRHDEDERFASRQQQQSAPLIARDDDESVSSGSPKGWLAHLAASPSMHRPRTPSPAPSSSDSDPPPELYAPKPKPKHKQTPQPRSLSLTESLLPRDGRTRPLDVFSLPDPRHTPRGRRKYIDSVWTSIWLFGVSVCVVFSIVMLFAAPQPDKKVPRTVLPYVTLLHTVPLLTILTFVSAAVAYAHIFLLQIFVRPVMIATSVFIPVTLLISSIWAFIGSFMYDGNEPTWGETVGLRLFSIIPLILAIITGRRLLHLPQQIHTTSSTLTLTTHLLMANPFLLALSPVVLLATLIASLPFLTLIFRLLLIGTVLVWLWSWGVSRGVMRMTTASVIAAWYFADPSLPPPPPSSTHTIHSALFRATGPSLGSTVLAALILTVIRMLTLFTIFLQRLPIYLPLRVVGIVMPAIRFLVGYIEGATTALSKYALVYAGITGDNFMGSARRARSLTSAVENNIRSRERGRGISKEPPLTLLTISPLTLTFPFALITYIFVAHTLNSPNEALGAAVLAGGVTALVGLFCVGLVKDTADTLYLCYCIDKDVGDRKREEVFIIRPPASRGPERIVPRSPAAPLSPGRQPQPRPLAQAQAVKPSPQRQNPQQPTRTGGSSRVPLPQHFTQPTLTRTTPLAPPPPLVEEEAPDPFKQSFVADEEEDEDDDPPQTTQPLQLRRESRGGPAVAPVILSSSPRSMAAFAQQQQPRSVMRGDRVLRMMTSAELNMKSHVFDPARRGPPSVDSSDEEGDSRLMEPLGSGNVGASYAVSSEMEQGSLQLSSQMQRSRRSDGLEESDMFPGSGFFK